MAQTADERIAKISQSGRRAGKFAWRISRSIKKDKRESYLQLAASHFYKTGKVLPQADFELLIKNL